MSSRAGKIASGELRPPLRPSTGRSSGRGGRGAAVGQDEWVYDAVRTGRLPCIRVRRHIPFTRGTLEEWL